MPPGKTTANKTAAANTPPDDLALRALNLLNASATITLNPNNKNLNKIVASAARKPVTLANGDGKAKAVVISARRYRQMKQALQHLADEEDDRYWLQKVRNARPQEYLSAEETEAFFRKIAEMPLPKKGKGNGKGKNGK